MKNKKHLLNLLLAFGLGISSGYAQESSNASGGDASGSGGTVAYSIGQVSYSYISGSNGNISEGVEQPYEIFSVGVTETVLDIELSVFPNPTVASLTLQIGDYNNQKLEYQLFDLQGKVVERKQITANQVQIETSTLSAATYFLNIYQDNKQIQSFKIIKN